MSAPGSNDAQNGSPAEAALPARDDDEPTRMRLPLPEARPSSYFSSLVDTQAIQSLLAALVAWTITVAPAGLGRGGGALGRVAALFALLAGAAGPMLIPVRRRLARHIGISAFLALSTLSWLVSSYAIQPARLDPTRGLTGALAWGVFALAWSERWTLRRGPTHDPAAPLLQARATLPRLAIPIATVGIVGALVCIAAAWRVRDVERALVAQAMAVATAVALVATAASVGVLRGKRTAVVGRRINAPAARALMLLVMVAVAGAVAMIALR
jgi:hypothetical protein